MFFPILQSYEILPNRNPKWICPNLNQGFRLEVFFGGEGITQNECESNQALCVMGNPKSPLGEIWRCFKAWPRSTFFLMGDLQVTVCFNSKMVKWLGWNGCTLTLGNLHMYTLEKVIHIIATYFTYPTHQFTRRFTRNFDAQLPAC
jgi:hypothetical protein